MNKLQQIKCCSLSLRHFKRHLSRISSKYMLRPSSEKFSEGLDQLIVKHQDKIIYNTLVQQFKQATTVRKAPLKTVTEIKDSIRLTNLSRIEPLPLALKYLPSDAIDLKNVEDETLVDDVEIQESPPNRVHFPFKQSKSYIADDDVQPNEDESVASQPQNRAEAVVQRRKQLLKKSWKWMSDYDNFNERECEEADTDHELTWKVNYGTPDATAPISDIPCGGCGALLHCKEPSLPGYIPSEIYKNHKKKGGINLKSLICQRCHFLKNYNIALQVSVTEEEYPQILESIKDKPALILLMVDLLDFPCSLWPGIGAILGRNKSIILLGNKADLLPPVGRGYLKDVRRVLEDSAQKLIGHVANIEHTALISAKTGWGIEDLITKLHKFWNSKGDVYLIGCTNVGKSTLFNSLLQSDYCKIQAVDLIQRATTSHWPGTTLNLLKFPILKPNAWRLFVRAKRLGKVRQLDKQERRLRDVQFKKTKDLQYANLIGHIDRTFTPENMEMDNVMRMGNNRTELGIDEKSCHFALSKWCYDTPGVVHPNQIIHLLTVEELLLTLPKSTILPQTFLIKPNWSVLIGGLARFDFIGGSDEIRITVFCASTLPITICSTDDVDSIYDQLLGTELLAVPMGTAERLAVWPKLQPSNDLAIKGMGKYTCCDDLVLSNAGWISIACPQESEIVVRGWTPECKGIYIRKSLLPEAVNSRGIKIQNSPAYHNDYFFSVS